VRGFSSFEFWLSLGTGTEVVVAGTRVWVDGFDSFVVCANDGEGTGTVGTAVTGVVFMEVLSRGISSVRPSRLV